MHGVLLVASIGLALHLVLPEIPGLERSLRLIVVASHLLVGAAFVAEVLSELCYAELLTRSVGTISRLGFSSPVRKRGGINRWFMLRLTVTGYSVSQVGPQRSPCRQLRVHAPNGGSGPRAHSLCPSNVLPLANGLQ